eukprot:Gregarina_sp_Poly_1__1619@NODE_140_length_13084_cov_215_910194_g125_i0_p4_GENE_NODE_140_length_13084_cov_215_910194_g125_i0NODE_140_length_13084_cov_215_910194_g125_i0_p4_ORF_typecomplete_len333_score42_68Amidinotransf/PF02274_17/1_1e343HCDH_RFF/PF18321_1/0_41_NODE_140_length_13084_cov_215_910194_g125_i01120512203
MSTPANTVLMVRPCRFGFNEETAATNAMQQPHSEAETVEALAAEEFASYVQLLETHGVNVVVVDDVPEPVTPDAVFSNNWISTDSEGTIVIFPMCCPNRRAERSKSVIKELLRRFEVKKIRDLSAWENRNEFLESTGSVVIDHYTGTGFACLSSRTTGTVLDYWAGTVLKKLIKFRATAKDDKPVYHTNIIMSIGESFAILAAEMIRDDDERRQVVEELQYKDRRLVTISEDQAMKYAGNSLQLRNKDGNSLLIMSSVGWDKLTREQQKALETTNSQVLTPHIPTIELVGGGSARCMLTEIFLPPKARYSAEPVASPSTVEEGPSSARALST